MAAFYQFVGAYDWPPRVMLMPRALMALAIW
jgi:hypothetical protein